MRIQKKNKFLAFVLILLTVFSFTPLYYCDNDDYEISIEERAEIVWRINEADEEQINKLLTSTDLDDSIFDYEEDDKIKYSINNINEVSDEYYLISYDVYENDVDVGINTEKIAMDPGDMAEDWEDLSLDDYSIMFILTETEDYLDDFAEEVSEDKKNNLYTTSSSIILNFSFGAFYFWLKLEYDERGILDELSLVYDGDEIFNMEQRSYSGPEIEMQIIWIIIIVIIIIAVLGFVAIIVIISTKTLKKKKSTKVLSIKPEAPIETEKMDNREERAKSEIKPEIIKTVFCEICGAIRENDAAFCSYCGTRFK